MEVGGKPDDHWVVEDLAHHYRQRLNLIKEDATEADRSLQNDYHDYRQVAMMLRAVERAALLELWTENKINDEVLRELERELDLEDMRSTSLAR